MKDETIKDKRLRKERFASQPEIILPVPATLSELPRDYPKFLLKVKRLVSTSRTRAVVAASSGMTLMYWQIGKMILDRQDALKWGAKVVDRLSHDLKKAFPGMAGFSPRNLKYMRKFAEVWPDVEIVQRTVALVSWRTNISLMDKLHDAVARLWYAQKALKNGWSKEFLDICIENRLMDRHGAEPSNFKKTFSLAKAETVQAAFKDPYLFDFLGIDKVVRERELEDALVAHVEEFLIALGQGFAFVGRQVHVEFEGDDFYLDLLFYHLKLRLSPETAMFRRCRTEGREVRSRGCCAVEFLPNDCQSDDEASHGRPDNRIVARQGQERHACALLSGRNEEPDWRVRMGDGHRKGPAERRARRLADD